ncbi:hypothetical protein M527_26505 [Sphingobium indicum IP26]|nr:hypothetical protein M527_26505 [Sphingobium indicum IP26]
MGVLSRTCMDVMRMGLDTVLVLGRAVRARNGRAAM